MRTGFTKQKCPKCGGNIFVDREYSIEGAYVEQAKCLQCGYTCHLKPDTAFMKGFQPVNSTK